MPVTLDNSGASSTSGTALQFTFTCGANAVLLVAAGNVLSRSVSAMAYAGVAMTQLGFTPSGTYLWGLTAPAAGANTLSMQATGGAAGWAMIAVSYLNAKSINPFGTIVSATATAASNFNLSVSSTNTDKVVAFYRVNSLFAITANNGTQLQDTSAVDASGNVNMMAADITGAATISLSATCLTAVNWQVIAIPVQFSATATTNFKLRALMGAGY